MENIYIIGDVHGCYTTLLALVDKLPKNAKICFVGDLIDRGKNSKEVIEFVRSNNYDCVLGNHEYFMIESFQAIETKKANDIYLKWINKGGGLETLSNYKRTSEIKNDVDFLKTLPYYIEYKDYKTSDGRYLVVSHSNVGKVWELRNSSHKSEIDFFQNHLIWSRNKYCDVKEIFNVYGHTILNEPLIDEYNANIDLGCYKTEIENPRLCALEFPSMKIYTQENIEK